MASKSGRSNRRLRNTWQRQSETQESVPTADKKSQACDTVGENVGGRGKPLNATSQVLLQVPPYACVTGSFLDTLLARLHILSWRSPSRRLMPPPLRVSWAVTP